MYYILSTIQYIFYIIHSIYCIFFTIFHVIYTVCYTLIAMTVVWCILGDIYCLDMLYSLKYTAGALYKKMLSGTRVVWFSYLIAAGFVENSI